MFHAYRSRFAVLLLAMLVTACTPERASENESLASVPPETPPAFMVGHWAPDASSCPDMSWRITDGGLQTPGEVTCRFEELRRTPRGAEADAVCVAEGPPERWNIHFAYAESARALLIEDAPFADTGLVRCEENAADIETGALSANGQKAAAAVQAYFALLTEGSADAAHRFLASDEAESTHEALARQLAGRASEDIATGPAGRVEGAAGSLYVSVPVALHGTNDTTEYFGNITLRRSNDVPGSTAEQRAWRIVRIDWQAISDGE